MFCEVSVELANERGLENGGWATILTARAAIEARVLISARIRPFKAGRRVFQQIGVPYHWGSSGRVTGDSVNELTNFAADPNVSIMNSKAHTCDIVAGRRARELRPSHLTVEGVPEPGRILRDLPAARERTIGKHLVESGKDQQGEQT